MSRNPSVIAALAYVVNAIRPEWDRPGVIHILNRADPSVDMAALAHAAITAAATRKDQATPSVIAMTGAHWGTCTGEKPAIAAPRWQDPYADTKPADPETVRAIRATRKEAS